MGIHLMPPLYEMVLTPEIPIGPYSSFIPVIKGHVWRSVGAGTNWNDIRNGAGNGVNPSGITMYTGAVVSDTGPGWATLYRGIVGWDLSGETDPVLAAYIAMLSAGRYDEMNKAPKFNIFGATPATPGALAAADYGNCGSIPYNDAIDYADWPDAATVQYFVLNAFAREALNAAIGVGQFSVSLREAKYDAPDVDPGATVATKRMEFFNSGTGLTLYLAREAP